MDGYLVDQRFELVGAAVQCRGVGADGGLGDQEGDALSQGVWGQVQAEAVRYASWVHLDLRLDTCGFSGETRGGHVSSCEHAVSVKSRRYLDESSERHGTMFT